MAAKQPKPAGSKSSNRRRCNSCRRVKVGAAFRTPKTTVCRACESRV